ncbi:MAG: class III extradiol ring-cleavage dioxygenase [Cyanobacteria bacterium J06641_5]
MSKLPALFISHGAPDLPLRTGSTQDFLRQLSSSIPKPKAILVVTAHWLTAWPTTSTATNPKTIYDFGGFSPELYRLNYPAPGDPKIAGRVATVLNEAGFMAQANSSRGYDHGTWTPLLLIYPEAVFP